MWQRVSPPDHKVEGFRVETCTNPLNDWNHAGPDQGLEKSNEAGACNEHAPLSLKGYYTPASKIKLNKNQEHLFAFVSENFQ